MSTTFIQASASPLWSTDKARRESGKDCLQTLQNQLREDVEWLVSPGLKNLWIFFKAMYCRQAPSFVGFQFASLFERAFPIFLPQFLWIWKTSLNHRGSEAPSENISTKLLSPTKQTSKRVSQWHHNYIQKMPENQFNDKRLTPLKA